MGASHILLGSYVAVYSAGIEEHGLNSYTMKAEVMIDISQHHSKFVSELANTSFLIVMCSVFLAISIALLLLFEWMYATVGMIFEGVMLTLIEGSFLMIKSLLASCLFVGSVCAVSLPDVVSVYPIPHDVILTGDLFDAPRGIVFAGDPIDKDAGRVLKEAFDANGGLFTVTVKSIEQTVVGAYTLTVTAMGAVIETGDPSGQFYAAQTLSQMARNSKLQPCVIKDWPDVAFRGTVEGFYGLPWSFEARKSQFRFYGKYKLNTYIYGPKDDPFHGFSNRWREPYPADQAEKIKALIRVAKENKVNFVWAVHPGRDISWKTDKDILACIEKFEMMYALGVRSFAIFFDDIGGEGARAEMQVKLLNRVNRDFVKKMPDVTPLILCPTQYNRAWSGGEYLTILGTQLDADISIMWTGNSVCTDITRESMDWINNRIQRKAFIWWNWPVSDYVRPKLLLGKAYGVDVKNKGQYSGFVSNPMDKPEASKIALFGVANYTWNITGHNPDIAWRDGIAQLFPECAEAIQCFAEHNADQGPNGHGYRREESVMLAPVAMRISQKLRANEMPDQADVAVLRAEFANMVRSADTILAKCQDRLFVNETENWVKYFREQALAGLILCDGIEKKVAYDTAITHTLQVYEKMDAIDAEQKKRPYQAGTRTGMRVIKPLMDEMMSNSFVNLQRDVLGKVLDVKEPALYRTIGTVPSLARATATRSGKYINFNRVMEVTTVKPGEWFGLILPEGVYANYIHANFETADAAKQGQIELSRDDGVTWKKQWTRNAGNEMQTSLAIDEKVNAARYINTSDKSVELKVGMFKLDVPDGAMANVAASMRDGQLTSFYRLQAGQSVTLLNVNASFKIIAVGDYTTQYQDETLVIKANTLTHIFEVLSK